MDDLVDLVAVVADHLFDGGQRLVRAGQDVARTIHDVLEGRFLGIDDGRFLVIRVQKEGRVGAATLQVDVGNARKRLKSECCLHVLAQRRGRIDTDRRNHHRGILRVEAEFAHIADLDAVEVDGASHRKAGDRRGEHDLDRKRARPIRPAAEPVDEDEADDQRHEDESADDHVVCAGFHRELEFPGLDPTQRPFAVEIGLDPGIVEMHEFLDCSGPQHLLLP